MAVHMKFNKIHLHTYDTDKISYISKTWVFCAVLRSARSSCNSRSKVPFCTELWAAMDCYGMLSSELRISEHQLSDSYIFDI